MGRRLLLWLVLPAGLVVGLFLLFFAPDRIDSDAMAPTLRAGDRVGVSRWAYGDDGDFRRVPGRLLGLFQPGPDRGDVVVIVYPGSFWSLRDRRQVRRVIGIAGDRVEVRGDMVLLNGAALDRRPQSGPVPAGMLAGARRFIETLPPRRPHEILLDPERASDGKGGVYTVPPGHIFVLGDNRDAVQDSRSENGLFVPNGAVLGRADVVFYAFDDGAAFWEIWRWPATFRSERFMKAVR